jgi:mRNA-degrading endonuclease RelE of RelBE toxin-antitoxin system
MRAMADDPFSGDTQKLEGWSNRWRRRVGDYRILFAIEAPRTIHVSTIARRTSTTY